jgi:UDP-glucose 4-epimerase
MKCIVTGATGFIGSSLCERLLNQGFDVIGIDSFVDYYPRALKERNITNLKKSQKFIFIEGNLLNLNLSTIISNDDCIFHQAAQAGVRSSWGRDFYIYTENNIMATQQLLEVCKGKSIAKLIFASSSSIYGDCRDMPMKEVSIPSPVSPYGVSKLASEQLCYLYWKNYNVPVVSLRYFTVYGPRQRPDMAFNKFITALLKDKEIIMYGDGEQTRDFTYIDDIVTANILVMNKGQDGNVYNIGGGSRVSLNVVIEVLAKISGRIPKIKQLETQKGDMRHTCADITKAEQELGYKPNVRLEYGLEKEYLWIKENLI